MNGWITYAPWVWIVFRWRRPEQFVVETIHVVVAVDELKGAVGSRAHQGVAVHVAA